MEGRRFYPGARSSLKKCPEGHPGSSSTNKKLEKNRRKNLGGTLLDGEGLMCMVAHMGFPAAALNERIKNKKKTL
jgi:hypothetical protein